MQRDIETEVKRGLGIDIPELRVEEAAPRRARADRRGSLRPAAGGGAGPLNRGARI